MTDILVLYASTHGHTGRIAAGVARALERSRQNSPGRISPTAMPSSAKSPLPERTKMFS